MGGKLVREEFGGAVPAVEVEPLGEATEAFWMLALLFRLEPKAKFFKRELMTSTRKAGRGAVGGGAVGQSGAQASGEGEGDAVVSRRDVEREGESERAAESRGRLAERAKWEGALVAVRK